VPVSDTYALLINIKNLAKLKNFSTNKINFVAINFSTSSSEIAKI
jgi:hypothetical protein